MSEPIFKSQEKREDEAKNTAPYVDGSGNELTEQQLLLYMYRTLSAVKKNLDSIRSMMTFFVVLIALAIVFQACNVLTSFGR